MVGRTIISLKSTNAPKSGNAIGSGRYVLGSRIKVTRLGIHKLFMMRSLWIGKERAAAMKCWNRAERKSRIRRWDGCLFNGEFFQKIIFGETHHKCLS